MTVNELRNALDALVEADPDRADMQVRFGPEMQPVFGGIIRRDGHSRSFLSLAPIKLDQVGGF